jgi:ketosteroid isomerase-like protein
MTLERATAREHGTDPLSVYRAGVAANNEADLAAALACYADDAVVAQEPGPPGTTGMYRGNARIAAFLRGAFAQHLHIDILGTPEVSGDRVTSRDAFLTDDLRALGLAPLEQTVVTVVRDGRINSIRLTLTAESQARLQAARARAGGVPG